MVHNLMVLLQQRFVGNQTKRTLRQELLTWGPCGSGHRRVPGQRANQGAGS